VSGDRPRSGEALALCRRLARGADPLAAYASLSDGGRRPGTMLLERSDGPTLILDAAALRVECRGHEVRLEALSANGGNLLDAVASALPEAVSERRPAALVLRFPPPREVDAEARLLAPSPFDALRALTHGMRSLSAEEPFTLACLGILAFDHVDCFETLPPAAGDPLDFPDFLFWIAESLIVFDPGGAPRAVCTAFGSDQIKDSASAYYAASQRLLALVERFDRIGAGRIDAPAAPAAPKAAEVDLDDAAYGALVASLKENIAAGDVYQIVLSRTFRAPCPDPLGAFAALRRADPSPYLFYVSAERHLLFGASPETSVRVVSEEGWPTVEVKPIAGTRPRGADADEDDRLEAELRLDAKELAEHMMLVDLARNDVARISLKGRRRVARLMSVERYARVMHLVSSVKGPLAIGFDALHALQACLNVGTLSGAPKIRATELLRETEATKRGPYGGAVGWLNGDGEMDSGVIIRSAVVKDGTAFVRAGAGIVHDSDPACEAEETRRKASAILSALAAAGATR
jgi:anthranilate synthase component 1